MDFQEELDIIITGEAIRIIAYSNAISFCQNRLLALKRNFLKDKKHSIEEEQQFFKITKQIPQTQLFYYWALREYQANYPLVGNGIQKEYVKAKRKEVIAFLGRYKDFQKYIRLGENHFDHLYFTRNSSTNPNKAQPIGSILEADFYTSHDILLSQITANNKLLHFYNSELKNLKQRKSNEAEVLEWCGSKVAFAELVYALYHSGAIDRKKTSVKAIASVLTKCFQITSFNIYENYSDIKRRKKEPTAFINHMLGNLNIALAKTNSNS